MSQHDPDPFGGDAPSDPKPSGKAPAKAKALKDLQVPTGTTKKPVRVVRHSDIPNAGVSTEPPLTRPRLRP
jgi:hypothetical protein